MLAASIAIQQFRAALNKEKDRLSQSDAVACIESISSIIRELKVHFNACSPIGRLPEAILTTIFKFAAFNDAVRHTEAFKWRMDVDFGTLVSLTHVCSEWRCIALDYPELWTRLDIHRTHNRKVFKTLVKRTKSMPLDINLSIDHYGFKCDSSCYFKKYAPRTRHMQISIMDMYGISSVARVLSSLSFHALESLVISCDPLVTDEEELPFPFPSPLDKVLISGQEISHLKALALDAMDILPFIPANRFPDLTHVRIRLVRIDMATLSCLLSHSPQIQFFGLEAARYFSDTGYRGSSPIVMSNMKTVLFSSSKLQTVFKILSYLSLPTWSLIRFINMQGLEDLPDDAPSPLISLFNQAKLSVYHATHIEFGSNISSYGFFIADGPSERIWLQHERRHVRWKLSDCLGLRSTVSFSAVTSLVLGTEYWNAHDPVTFLQAFPRLADLSLTLFLNIDKRTTPRPESLIHILASSPTTCLDLRSLSITCSFNTAYDHTDGPIRMAAELATDIMSLVKARDAAGVPLKCLTVQPHQVSLYTVETKAVTAAIQNLYAQFTGIVEEFKYMEPGVGTIQCGARMTERFLPGYNYCDIMRHHM